MAMTHPPTSRSTVGIHPGIRDRAARSFKTGEGWLRSKRRLRSAAPRAMHSGGSLRSTSATLHHPQTRQLRSPCATGIARTLSHSRGGFTLVELMVSGLLLGAVMLVTVPTMHHIAWEHRAAVKRQIALEEVANMMERFTARGWNNIDNDAAGNVTISDSARRQLPQAKSIIVVQKGPEPDSKRITLTLTWTGRFTRPNAPVRLTAWVYRHGGTQ